MCEIEQALSVSEELSHVVYVSKNTAVIFIVCPFNIQTFESKIRIFIREKLQ